MTKDILKFLEELQVNNNREWFQANKGRYDTCKDEFIAFIDRLIPAIAKFDETVKFIEGKDCMFRIYRDTRFAKDKTPYKTNFGAFIARGGRKSHGPGYYFHMQPGESFLAVGVWMPDPDLMKAIRQEIFYGIDEFKKILGNKTFKTYFSGIDEWDKQKLAPKEYPKDFPDIDLLKNRSFTASTAMDDKKLSSEGLYDFVMKVYKAGAPYNDFLRRAAEK
jgi:uncharacterized protein (TIGR02453 family)